MAYPSGTGTEIVFSGSIATQSTDATAFRWDQTNPTLGTETYTVPALHIITVISIIWCEVGGAAETFSLYGSLNSATISILDAQALAANSTFVWNDRFALVGGDKLITVASSGDMDIIYTFIDQDWT